MMSNSSKMYFFMSCMCPSVKLHYVFEGLSSTQDINNESIKTKKNEINFKEHTYKKMKPVRVSNFWLSAECTLLIFRFDITAFEVSTVS